MTPAIAKKIAAIAGSIPPLKKETNNRDAGFNFVSIDDYYAHVAGKVREGGLIWTIDEDGIELITDGVDEPLVQFGYVFTIYDVDADLDIDGVLPSAKLHQSIIHPLQGAQTTGSAASYAEKIFLRTLLKIVTGEPDADFFAKKKKARAAAADDFMEPAPTQPPARVRAAAESEKPPEPEPEPPQQEVVEDTPNTPFDVMLKALEACEDLSALRKWRKVSKMAIDDIKDNDKDKFETLQAAYTKKLKSLEVVE